MDIKLTLTQDEVNQVLGALAKLPIEVALNTFAKIKQQGQAQVDAADKAKAEEAKQGEKAKKQ